MTGRTQILAVFVLALAVTYLRDGPFVCLGLFVIIMFLVGAADIVCRVARNWGKPRVKMWAWRDTPPD